MGLRRDVSRALVAEGFKRTGRAHIRRIDDDFSLMVDTGPVGDQDSVAPWAGLRSEKVENLSSELCDLPFTPHSATVAANVGYVIDGNFRQWMGVDVGPLLPANEQDATSQVVLVDIHAALLRLERYCRIERLPAAWREIPVAGSSPSVGYSRVVVQLLLGNPGNVLEELDNAEREYCRKPDEVCEDFQRFKARVMERVEGVS